MGSAARSEPLRSPYGPPVVETRPHRCGPDHATDTGVLYPTERRPRPAGPSTAAVGYSVTLHMHDASPFMSEDDQDEEDSEPRGWNRKESQGHKVFNVILEEGLPGGRWRRADRAPVRLHRRFGDLDSQLPEFPTMRGDPPGGVGAPHLPDQVADVFGKGGTARFAALAQTSPRVPEPSLLSGDDGARPDERQGRHSSPTTAVTATLRRGDPSAGAWAAERSVDRRRADAVGRGFRGAETRETESAIRRKR